jgi:hypothetical protein
VQVVRAFLKVHGKDQPDESQVMITVQVADEYVIDAVKIRLHLHELHLRRFATIHQK